MNADEFLETKTSFCERLHMRLTPEACAEIRGRRGGYRAFEDSGSVLAPPPTMR
jgi:hypothetical protein